MNPSWNLDDTVRSVPVQSHDTVKARSISPTPIPPPPTYEPAYEPNYDTVKSGMCYIVIFNVYKYLIINYSYLLLLIFSVKTPTPPREPSPVPPPPTQQVEELALETESLKSARLYTTVGKIVMDMKQQSRYSNSVSPF